MTSEMVKQVALQSGADLVGIASMDRFEGAPPGMDPRYIFPDAQAAIVLGFRIPRGCFRGIEEGTYFAAYPSMGYAGINLVVAPLALRAVTLYLEDEGWEAVPIQNMVIDAGVDITTGEVRPGRRRVRPDLPAPDVMPHFRIAAVAAGLGEIGYSKVFLSPQFGPRQRLAMLLTDAPLEPDPIFEGEICDRCMLCVKECSGQAISPTEMVKVTIGGRTFEFGKLDEWRCTLAYTGGVPETSPFVPEGWDFEAQVGRRWAALNDIPYNRSSLNIFHHLGAIEGARGCIRACMIHLEETGRIGARFHNPFRRRPAWRLA